LDEGVDPRILNLINRLIKVVNFTPRTLYSWRKWSRHPWLFLRGPCGSLAL